MKRDKNLIRKEKNDFQGKARVCVRMCMCVNDAYTSVYVHVSCVDV